MNRYQRGVWAVGLGVLALVNLNGLLLTAGGYKGWGRQVGSDVVHVLVPSGQEEALSVPLMERQADSGRETETGARVAVYLRNDYHPDADDRWYHSVTLEILGGTVLASLILRWLGKIVLRRAPAGDAEGPRP